MRLHISLHKFSALVYTSVIFSVGCGLTAQAQVPAQQPPAGGNPATTKPAPAPTSNLVQAPTSRGGTGIRPLSDDEIKLSAGDVIQIQVQNHVGLDGAYTVPGVGRLLLPEAGEIPVAGLTIKQVRTNLQKELEKSLNNVFVEVLLREVHSRHAAVAGYVLHPGSYDMSTNQYQLLDIIDMTGGLISPLNRPDVRISEYSVSLYRQKTTVPIDLNAAYNNPNGTANFIVEPNDRIVVDLKPLVAHEVHVLGSVPRQGGFPLDNNTTILRIFGLSGYPSTTAALSKAYVLRSSQIMPLDLRPLLTGKPDPEANTFKFVDGDILYIPAVTATFMVWGQVGRQGNYPFPEVGKINLLDAITNAGESANGEYRKVHLIRTVNGKQVDKTINVDKMIKKES